MGETWQQWNLNNYLSWISFRPESLSFFNNNTSKSLRTPSSHEYASNPLFSSQENQNHQETASSVDFDAQLVGTLANPPALTSTNNLNRTMDSDYEQLVKEMTEAFEADAMDDQPEQENAVETSVHDEIEDLTSRVSGLQAALDSTSVVLFNQAEGLHAISARDRTIAELTTQLEDQAEKTKAAWSTGYEAGYAVGGNKIREMAEARHSEIIAAYLEQIEVATARADRAEKERGEETSLGLEQIREAESRTIETEKQIAGYQTQLEEANAGRAEANARAAFHRKAYSELEARFKLAQDQLEQAEVVSKARVRAESERALLTARLAQKESSEKALSFDVERERAKTKEHVATIGKLTRLAVEQSRNDDESSRRIVALSARVLELGSLAAAPVGLPVVGVLAARAGHRSGRSALLLFLAVAAVVTIVGFLFGMTSPTAESGMYPCGQEGMHFSLCRNSLQF